MPTFSPLGKGFLTGKIDFAQKQWTVPIPGTTKLHRLEENVAAVDVELTHEDLQEIETAAAQISAQGARYAEAQQRMIDR